jgi:hypothetical protein
MIQDFLPEIFRVYEQLFCLGIQRARQIEVEGAGTKRPENKENIKKAVQYILQSMKVERCPFLQKELVIL